ncbi:MAG: hypothetical protein NVSMB45_11780 [Ginsengibacter sp.]
MVHSSGKDSTVQQFNFIRATFSDSAHCMAYVHSLTALLYDRGYIAASIDSLITNSTNAELWLYIGPSYKGLNFKYDSSTLVMSFKQYSTFREHLLNQYLSSGYPFVTMQLNNVELKNDFVFGQLLVNPGLLYHIDSIRQFGNLSVKKNFLYHYLSIKPGNVYDLHKIENVQKKLLELPFANQVQKADVTMLGTGAVLNVYAESKKSSQLSALIGFLPQSNSNHVRVTADVNMSLLNALHSGESIILNWQQLQQQSPKLNLGYIQPFIFNSPATLDSKFDLFKKDSSYVLLNGRIGLSFQIAEKQSGNIFLQSSRSYLLQGAFDTNLIRVTKQLPSNIDYSLSQLGFEFHFKNTDYEITPRRGTNVNIIAAAGIKKVNMSNDIVNLKDPGTPAYNFKTLYDTVNKKDYQLNLHFILEHYSQLNNRSVLKLALNSALIESSHLFKNEVFIIGGYRIMRGFDEEGIYTTKYVVITSEYRYLTGINSFLYFFNDIGFTESKYQSINNNNNYVSIGSGVSFETKYGLLNVSYALGKRNDIPFNLTNASKIHFGFISYF